MKANCAIHRDEVKTRILLAAKKEFSAKGFGGATMRSIAAEAGVNQAMIHYYFSTKENMYKNIFQRHVAAITEKYLLKFCSEIDSWNAGAELKLCAAIYTLVYLEPYLCDAEIEGIIVHEIADGGGIFYDFMIKQYLAGQISSLEKIIREGVESGIFEIPDTVIFSAGIILFLKELSHGPWLLKDSGLPGGVDVVQRESMYNYMTEFSFKALKPSHGEMNIPELDEYKKKEIGLIFNELRCEIKKFLEE